MAPVALDKIRDVPFWDDPRRHCLGKDTALFFPANYNASAVSPALRLCNGDNGPPCPVLAACATWALTHPGHGGLYSFHTGGAQVVLADGAVRFLSANMKSEIFVFMVTRAGGEVVPGSEF